MTQATFLLISLSGVGVFAQRSNPIYDVVDLLSFSFLVCLGGCVIAIVLGVVIAGVKWWLNWQIERQARLVEIAKAQAEVEKVQMESQLVRADNGIVSGVVGSSGISSMGHNGLAISSSVL